MRVKAEVEEGGVEKSGDGKDVGENLREEGVDLDLLLLDNTAGTGEGW